MKVIYRLIDVSLLSPNDRCCATRSAESEPEHTEGRQWDYPHVQLFNDPPRECRQRKNKDKKK